MADTNCEELKKYNNLMIRRIYKKNKKDFMNYTPKGRVQIQSPFFSLSICFKNVTSDKNVKGNTKNFYIIFHFRLENDKIEK